MKKDECERVVRFLVTNGAKPGRLRALNRITEVLQTSCRGSDKTAIRPTLISGPTGEPVPMLKCGSTTSSGRAGAISDLYETMKRVGL